MLSPWEVDAGSLEIREVSLTENDFTFIPEELEGYLPTPEEIAEMHENEDIVETLENPTKPSEYTATSITEPQTANSQLENSSTEEDTSTSLPATPEEPVAAEITSNPPPEPETNSSPVEAPSNPEDFLPLEEFPLAPENDTTAEKYLILPRNLAYLSESWNATVFTAKYANHIFFRAESGHGQNWLRSGWFIWDSGRWTPNNSHTVVNRMQMTITQMSEIAQACYCKDDLKIINAHVKKSLSRTSIWNSLQIAANTPTLNVKASRLDSNPLLLNLETAL